MFCCCSVCSIQCANDKSTHQQIRCASCFCAMWIMGSKREKSVDIRTSEKGPTHDELTNHNLAGLFVRSHPWKMDSSVFCAITQIACALCALFRLMNEKGRKSRIHILRWWCQVATILYILHSFILHHINGAYFIVNRSCHTHVCDVAWSVLTLDCSNWAKRNKFMRTM